MTVLCVALAVFFTGQCVANWDVSMSSVVGMNQMVFHVVVFDTSQAFLLHLGLIVLNRSADYPNVCWLRCTELPILLSLWLLQGARAGLLTRLLPLPMKLFNPLNMLWFLYTPALNEAKCVRMLMHSKVHCFGFAVERGA